MPSRTNNFPTVGDCLLHHIEQGHTDRDKIAAAARRSYSTACRWVNGETEPTVSEMAALVERLPRAVGDDLRALLPCRDERFDVADLDRNGNGKIDLGDALESAIQDGRIGQDKLEAMLRAGAMGRSVSPTPTQMTEILELVNRQIRSLEQTRQILQRVGETVPRMRAV